MKRILFLAGVLLSYNTDVLATEAILPHESDSDSSYSYSDCDALIEIENIMKEPGGIVDFALANKTLLNIENPNYPSKDMNRIRKMIQERENQGAFLGQVGDAFISIPRIDAAQDIRFSLMDQLLSELRK